MLLRYKIVPAEEIRGVRVGGEWAITQLSLVDSDHDYRVVIGLHGIGMSGPSPDRTLLEPVAKAYSAAHGGATPSDLSQLLPFATTEQQRAAIERRMRKGQ